MKIFKEQKINKKRLKSVEVIGTFSLLIFVCFISVLIDAKVSNAQNTSLPEANPTSSDFKLIICDGPVLPPSAIGAINFWKSKNPGKTYPKDYIPCDFNGAMMQIQYLINVMLVVGILAAIVGFSWAGYLFITGVAEKRNQAKDIFSKIVWGLVIMICAWFMVYQLVKWLVPKNSGVDYLLKGERK